MRTICCRDIGLTNLLCVVLVMAAMFAMPAHADIFISTYGPGHTFSGAGLGDTTSDTTKEGHDVVIAAEFHTIVKTRFVGARLAVSGLAPHSHYMVAIAADSGTHPALPSTTFLEIISGTADAASCCITPDGHGHFKGTGITVAASGSLVLEANKHYWLAIIVPHSTWSWSSALPALSANGDRGIASGTYDASSKIVNGWQPPNFNFHNSLAFEIYGPPPKPPRPTPCKRIVNNRVNTACVKAIDPMALILSQKAYLIWVEIHHPNGPLVADMQATLQRMTPEDREMALQRAKSVVDYGEAIQKANAALERSEQK